MRPEIASQPLARARFLREAKAMAAVKHEHVAAIYSANEEADGTTWLAMELLEGESLDDAVKRGGPFDAKAVCRIGREVALGLAAAHAKRLIHRDVKPANIWLEAPDGKVKLLDFGHARIIKIKNKDGTETEIKVPDTATVTVLDDKGKTVALVPPKKPADPLPATVKNGIGMACVKVPKGTAWLGGGAGKQGETKVVFDQDFYLGKDEVTQEEWAAVTGLNPSHFGRNGAGKDAVKDIPDADLKRFPAESVSWDDCQLFIKRLNEKLKDTGWVDRLPKEAEWEYACRGGPVDTLDSAFDFYFEKPANTLQAEQANFDSPKVLKHSWKVGSSASNILGLFDMHGNVSELCDDTEKAADGASHRVSRGGSRYNPSRLCRAANRHSVSPSAQSIHISLRLARVPVGTQGTPTADVAKYPPLKPIAFKPVPVGESPFDKRDPRAIPAAERLDSQPRELVAVIGTPARRRWSIVAAVAISPDGKHAATVSDGADNRDHIIFWDMAPRTPKWRTRWTDSTSGPPRLGTLDPRFGPDDKHRLCVGPAGYWRCSTTAVRRRSRPKSLPRSSTGRTTPPRPGC